MKLRTAQADDAASVAALWNGMIRDTLATFTTEVKSEADVAQMIAARADAFWVAEEGDVKGFASFGPFRAGPGYAATVEHTIIVAPDAHRLGVGSALLGAVEAGGQARGAHVLVAGISSANPKAVAFHAAHGFTQTALMPQVGCKAGQWLDLILMQKTISAA